MRIQLLYVHIIVKQIEIELEIVILLITEQEEFHAYSSKCEGDRRNK